MATASSMGVWRRWQRGAGSLLLAPLILAVLLGFALRSVPQLHEVYISAAEPKNRTHLVLGILALALLSSCLFFGYLSSWVVMRLAGVGYGSRLVYSDAVLIADDHRSVTVRNLLASICAALPFAGVFFGFRLAAVKLESMVANMNRAVEHFSRPHFLPDDLVGLHSSMFSIAWIIAAIGSLVVVLLSIAGRLEPRDDLRARWRKLWFKLHTSERLDFTYPIVTGWRAWIPFQWRWRMRTRLPLIVQLICVSMLCGAPLAQYLVPELYNAFFVGIGPMATLGLTLTTLSALLVVVGNWSRKIGFPIMLILLLSVLVSGYLSYADKPGPGAVAAPSAARNASGQQRDLALAQEFRTWLMTRANAKGFEGRKYPVFVIAAQGGGIYAAASAGGFFARMQDLCSNLAQHVFAISSVSGGSLGTVLYESSLAASQTMSPCSAEPSDNAAHQQSVGHVVRSDHFSGTVASSVPDVLFNLGRLIGHQVGFTWRPENRWGRDSALECSFLTAYYEKVPTAPISLHVICQHWKGKPSTGPGALAFKESWPSRSRLASPALILNTTRSETGDRIAFAPFDLGRVGDGTLFRFGELDRPNFETTWIQAAVTSARFPGMMPAKIVLDGSRWMNFVDGGYADSSGATAALEIYHTLRKIIENENYDWARNVDLRLVLLTDAPSVAGGEPRGDGLVHAISPITTLFSVRGQMARRAVKRALDDVLGPTGKTHDVRGCDDHDWPVRMIMLDQQTFSLPLGWMISTPTAELIDRMIGEPRKIDTPPPTNRAENEPDAVKRAANILYNNSCTMYSMTQLLAGNTAPITPAQP